ncbi:hypothetical protein [Amycolatopsis regifaucium]|uniref:Uncharacterized protein n=1 Tax=Amycolatopsis regifaucium TaxID=546365 RepID=A0A154MVY2_9PSEU|nr:hypothetical protein [Amycolatopsis regifaucium]KZB88518.1 hypothetical protein AVL48_00045 [Amycolatopsis regifaucium]OKA07311.1 hypothetical protein ATP06_0215745 [Amycolatopsis regifaucium]SFI49405.1 hypothetical protein SAMN04489731_1118 [Amycolatopsis regifaucium]
MSVVPPPARPGPLAAVRGFLAGIVIGTTLCAFVVGIIIEYVPLIIAGVGLPLVYGFLLYAAGAPRRAREAAIVPVVALAKIESLRASGTETGDIPVDFVLTVAPDGAASHRVKITHGVNLVDIPDHRPGNVLVVQYPPDRPWKAKIVERLSPEWERRVAEAVIESAPESSLVQEPPEGCLFGALTLLGLLLGAALVLFLFRAELFAPEAPARTEETQSSVTTSSSGSATVTVDRPLLGEGELRRAIDSLAGATDVSRVLTAVVEERRLTVVFAPTDAQVPRFDLRALAVDRVPALVERATTTIDVGSPRTWQVIAVPFGGVVSLRVVVTGPDGSGSLPDGG